MNNSVNNDKIWYEGLQAFRGWLFILVLISHSADFFETRGSWGAAAVEGFFLLSGFLYLPHNENDGILIFYKKNLKLMIKKIVKLYPLYFMFLLFAAFLQFETKRDFIKNIFLLQSYCLGNSASALSYNWPMWFLSSIMLSWILAPILFILVKKINSFILTFIIIGIQIICVIVFWNAEPYSTAYYYLYLCPISRMEDYLLGMILHKVFDSIKSKSYGRYINLFECIVFTLGVVELCFVDMFNYSLQLVIMWIPVFACYIILFAWKSGVITNFLTNHFSLRIGYLSPYLYIIHRLILMVISWKGTGVMFWLIAISLMIVLSVLYDNIIGLILNKLKSENNCI